MLTFKGLQILAQELGLSLEKKGRKYLIDMLALKCKNLGQVFDELVAFLIHSDKTDIVLIEHTKNNLPFYYSSGNLGQQVKLMGPWEFQTLCEDFKNEKRLVLWKKIVDMG